MSGETAWQAIDAGATAIVAGSAVFGGADYAAAIAAIRHSAPPELPGLIESEGSLDRDHLKRVAAQRAVEFVESGMIVGLGTGSTAGFVVEQLAARVARGLAVVAIPTSENTAALARPARHSARKLR